MTDAREYLMNFLAAVEREVPPSRGMGHRLGLAVERGDPRLALYVAAQGAEKPIVVVFIDPADLTKPVDLMVRECVQVLAGLHQAREKETAE